MCELPLPVDPECSEIARLVTRHAGVSGTSNGSVLDRSVSGGEDVSSPEVVRSRADPTDDESQVRLHGKPVAMIGVSRGGVARERPAVEARVCELPLPSTELSASTIARLCQHLRVLFDDLGMLEVFLKVVGLDKVCQHSLNNMSGRRRLKVARVERSPCRLEQSHDFIGETIKRLSNVVRVQPRIPGASHEKYALFQSVPPDSHARKAACRRGRSRSASTRRRCR